MQSYIKSILGGDNISSLVSLGFMLLWGIYSIKKILALYRSKNLRNINLYIYDFIPSGFTIIGIFGTFLGIFFGLLGFDVRNINNSIPNLLEGLKTSFSTSLVGIAFSFFSTLFIKCRLHKIESEMPEEPTDEFAALQKILLALNEIKEQNSSNFNKITRSIIGQHDDSISTQLLKLRSHLVEIEKINEKKLKSIEMIQYSIGGDKETSLLTQIQKLRVEQNEYFKESRENFKENIKNISTIIEVIDKNNEIIRKKIEEFSELLAKNSTEALVRIMEKTTEEFSKQMTVLINKLVQENFQELNNSVQRMNQWQQENKEMIQKLTEQFIKVSNEFEIASKSIKEITTYVAQLTNENGMLAKLIEELHYVMIEETKFREIVEKLNQTIDTIKKNTEAFDETTNKLNNWVRNQMNFTDSVAVLLKKLEEIEKIKDINEIFWSNTKKQLNEGVAIIEKASKTLAEDLENINAEFYERLNNTLQNLDLLIQRIIEKYKK